MSDWLPTYEYEGGKVSALFEGKVIVEGDTFAKVAETADDYLKSLRKERKAQGRESSRKTATHITTPNGLKGEILTRVAGIWGDEITVRFENGNIQRMEVAAGDKSIEYVKEAAAEPTNYREYFEQKLAATFSPNREGLTARLQDLEDLRSEAVQFMSAGHHIEAKAINQVVLGSQAETLEIKEALAHLDAVDAENAAPGPPVYAAVEQVELGVGAGSDWLEVTAREMIAASEAEDFDKLLAEGPTLLVSGLDDGAIGHTGTVREVAQAHVLARTAGFQGEAVEAYREQFVAAAETARRQELKTRTKTAKKTAKQEAAVVEGVSDEALFL